MLPLQSETKS